MNSICTPKRIVLPNVFKKIVVQNHGDAPQQGKVDGFFLEYFVNIVCCAWNLCGEPDGSTSLLAKFVANHLADMKIITAFHCRHVCLVVFAPTMKKREPFIDCLSNPKALANR